MLAGSTGLARPACATTGRISTSWQGAPRQGAVLVVLDRLDRNLAHLVDAVQRPVSSLPAGGCRRRGVPIDTRIAVGPLVWERLREQGREVARPGRGLRGRRFRPGCVAVRDAFLEKQPGVASLGECGRGAPLFGLVRRLANLPAGGVRLRSGSRSHEPPAAVGGAVLPAAVPARLVSRCQLHAFVLCYSAGCSRARPVASPCDSSRSAGGLRCVGTSSSGVASSHRSDRGDSGAGSRRRSPAAAGRNRLEPARPGTCAPTSAAPKSGS